MADRIILNWNAAKTEDSKTMDKIFLLSAEEYKKYEDKIPFIRDSWWLRSPGDVQANAAFVYDDGYLIDLGYGVSYDAVAVRPALSIDNPQANNLKIGDRFVEADFPWIVIDEGLAIAEVPIAWRRFDAESNDYETSDIRQFLIAWYAERTVSD